MEITLTNQMPESCVHQFHHLVIEHGHLLSQHLLVVCEVKVHQRTTLTLHAHKHRTSCGRDPSGHLTSHLLRPVLVYMLLEPMRVDQPEHQPVQVM